MEFQEGNPAIEQAERHALGTSTYEKAEVVHRFADTHSWVHPLFGVFALLVAAGIAWHLLRRKK